MVVEELVEKIIWMDPAKIRTKQEALEYIFLTSGNGLGWNAEGDIEALIELPKWVRTKEYDAARAMPEKVREALKPIINKRVKEIMATLKNIPTTLEDPVVSLTGDVFVERGSLLWLMPDNASVDWGMASQQLTADANLIFDE